MPNLIPISNTSSKLYIDGVSTLPPQDKGWYILIHDGYQLVFLKKGKGKRTYVINISIHYIPEMKDINSEEDFLHLVKKAHASEPETGRFVVVNNEETLDKVRGDYCVHLHTLAEDYGATNSSREEAPLLMGYTGYNCRHPENKSILVNFEYSHRYKENDMDPNWQEQADKFLKQVEFIRLTSAP